MTLTSIEGKSSPSPFLPIPADLFTHRLFYIVEYVVRGPVRYYLFRFDFPQVLFEFFVVVEFNSLYYYSFRVDFQSCSCSSFRLLLTLLLLVNTIVGITIILRDLVYCDWSSPQNKYSLTPDAFVSIRLSISCRTVSFFLSLRAVPILFVFFFFFVLLLLWLLLLPSLLWSWNRYLIWFGRTSFADWPSYYTYPSQFYRSVQYYNVSIARGTTTDLCIRTDPMLDLEKLLYRYFDTKEYDETKTIWYTIRHQDPLDRLIKKWRKGIDVNGSVQDKNKYPRQQ